MSTIQILGCITSVAYQEAKALCDDLRAVDENLEVRWLPHTEHQWLKARKKLEVKFDKVSDLDQWSPVVLHSKTGFVGGVDGLANWAAETYGFRNEMRDKPEYEQVLTALRAQCVKELSSYVLRKHTHYETFSKRRVYVNDVLRAEKDGKDLEEVCAEKKQSEQSVGDDSTTENKNKSDENQSWFVYFRFSTNSVPSDDGEEQKGASLADLKSLEDVMVVELHPEVCPKLSENFRNLCSGALGMSFRREKTRLHYRNTLVHRVLAGGWVQGGDLTDGSGGHSESSVGRLLADESFVLKHDGVGTVSMANNGAHTNGSQFFLTLQSMPALDGRHCVVGRVISGIDLLYKLGKTPCRNQRPIEPLHISESGVFAVPDSSDVVEGYGVPCLKPSQATAKSGSSSATQSSYQITIALLGEAGAGKTQLLASMHPEQNKELAGKTGDYLRTGGFSHTSLSYTKEGVEVDVTMYDLGGAEDVRDWATYIPECHGFVYCVDSTAEDKVLDAAKASWGGLSESQRFQGKPVLFACTRHDAPSEEEQKTEESTKARSLSELSSFFGLADRTGKNPIKAIQCSGVGVPQDDSVAVDSRIMTGMDWLVDSVFQNFEILSARVATDKEQAKAERDAQRKALLSGGGSD